MAVETPKGCRVITRVGAIAYLADLWGCLQPSSAPVRCVTDRVAGVAPNEAAGGLVCISSATDRMRSCHQYLMYLIRGYVNEKSICCYIIEKGKDVGRHSIAMSMTVSASKHRISQLINSQRLEVNTSAGTTRYRSSCYGIACDRGSPCSSCM